MVSKVTAEIFRAVKIMTAGGAKIDEMAKCLKISRATISRIKASETLEEYQTIQKDYQKKVRDAHKDDNPDKPDETEAKDDSKDQKQYDMVSNYQIGRMIELLKAQNELLTHISNKLAFVVEQLV